MAAEIKANLAKLDKDVQNNDDLAACTSLLTKLKVSLRITVASHNRVEAHGKKLSI